MSLIVDSQPTDPTKGIETKDKATHFATFLFSQINSQPTDPTKGIETFWTCVCIFFTCYILNQPTRLRGLRLITNSFLIYFILILNQPTRLRGLRQENLCYNFYLVIEILNQPTRRRGLRPLPIRFQNHYRLLLDSQPTDPTKGIETNTADTTEDKIPTK